MKEMQLSHDSPRHRVDAALSRTRTRTQLCKPVLRQALQKVSNQQYLKFEKKQDQKYQ